MLVTNTMTMEKAKLEFCLEWKRSINFSVKEVYQKQEVFVFCVFGFTMHPITAEHHAL